MNEVLRFALLGLATGAMYALASQGLILIYRGSGVLNFAHGAMAMISAFVVYDLGREYELPTWIAVSGGLLTGALLGLLIHVIFMRRLRNSSAVMRLIATLGVMAVLQSIATLRYGVNPKLAQSLYPTDLVEVGNGIVITVDRLWLVATACITTVLLWAFYKYSRFGIATTATAENQRSAAATGWSPDRVAAINWMLGGALAAAAGILLAPIVSIQVTVLTTVVIAAFAGALIANFTSFPIALLGGFLVGIAEALMQRYATGITGLGSSAPFLILIAVLVLRGRGLPVRGEVLDRLPSVGTGKVRMWLVVAAFAIQSVLILFVFDSSATAHLTVSMVFAIILLSIVLLTGYAGQISLAQAAAAGVGALIAARLIADLGVPFLVALILAALLVVPLGTLVALPALRTRGATLAVATLGIATAVQYMVFGSPRMTGSPAGLTEIGLQSIFGFEISATSHPTRYAVLCLTALTLVGLMVASVRRSRAGRRMIAVRDNERAAAALGVNVIDAKLFAFGVAASIAAIGGGLLALQGGTVQYEQFGFMASISVVLWAVVGGIGYIGGALLGSTLAPGGVGTLVTDIVFSSARGIIELVGGVLVLLIILLNPDGMMSENLKFGKHLASLFRKLRGEAKEVQDPASLPALLADEDTSGAQEPSGHTGVPLEVKGVTVRFGGVVAVDDVDLLVKPGRVHGLIGPNGAGKTTLVDAVTGFVKPAAGDVTLDGESILALRPHGRSRLGLMRSFQSLELFEDMTVRENIDTACDQNEFGEWFTSLVGGGRARLTDTALAAITEFDLAEDLDRFPSELSYGRRRLVGIARAVAAAPKVLLLDEPAAGLDDTESRELGHLIRVLAERWGLSILLIEHHVDLVMEVCDEISVLNFGKLIAHGTPAEIRNDADVRTAYLGEAEEGVASASRAGSAGTAEMEEVQ